MNFPNPLYPGAHVGLVAPASPVTPKERRQCVESLNRMGFSVVLGETLRQDKNVDGYLAGTARERAEDMNRMFADQRIAAIFCVRGGYGSAQLLEYLDYELIEKNPKIFVGYSDITSLHTVFQNKCSLVTFHGPMVKPDFIKKNVLEEEQEAFAWNRLLSAVYLKEDKSSQGMKFENPLGESFRVLCRGQGEGQITGGNLSVLARSLGTEFAPKTRGKILFLEDIGESIPRLDMYLTQMIYSGSCSELKGILLGDFTDCGSVEEEKKEDIDKFLTKKLAPLEVPIMANVCSDHRKPMGTIPLGAFCRMDTEKKNICFWP